MFESPIVHSPQRGREITFKYLTVALNVLGGPGFKYVGEWRGDSGAVLEFENEIEGVEKSTASTSSPSPTTEN